MTAGCADRRRETISPSDEAPVSRSATDGPVSLSITISPGTVEVGQRARVSLEAVGPRGVTLEVDDYRRTLLDGDRRFELGVTEFTKEGPVAANGDRWAWRYVYDVTFYLAGTFEFPPVVLHYLDPREEASSPSDERDTRELRTESIPIIAVDPTDVTLTEADLYDIKVLDPVELHRPFSHWVWIAPLVVAMLIAALMLMVRRRRQAIERRMVVLPAHEWAWRQIARLIADDLINKGQVQEFYYRVSDIVRGYLERRFSVAAPDMTTEEFLHASAGNPKFSIEHRDAVARFLHACDLVKYARHVPRSTEADELLAAARTFIEQTREHVGLERRLPPDASETQERAA